MSEALIRNSDLIENSPVSPVAQIGAKSLNKGAKKKQHAVYMQNIPHKTSFFGSKNPEASRSKNPLGKPLVKVRTPYASQVGEQNMKYSGILKWTRRDPT